MRRIFLLLILGTLWLPLGLRAQDRTAEAAARAQREEAEERYKGIHSRLESLAETQEMLLRNQEKIQQRIATLASEIDDLKRAQSRAGANYATRDQLKEMVEKVQEVDRKRIADNERVLEVLKELQKMPVAPAPAVPEKSAGAAGSEPLGPTWDYTVKTNDTLKKIVIGYNRELQKQGYALLTVSQVLKANPGLNQDKLYVGKKILIPIPPKKGEKNGRSRAND